jgi:O-antigen/teichoic acid export membrane protein
MPVQLAGDVLKIAGWILCMVLVATLRTRWFVAITLLWAACFVAGTWALVPQLGLHAASWAYLAAGVLQTALAAWALRGMLRRPPAVPAPAPAAAEAPGVSAARPAAPGGLAP